MKLYRLYHSTSMRIFRGFIMFTLLFLAFLEDPNSLTITPDPTNEKYVRPEVPRGLTESLEIICLLVIGAFGILETWLVGIKTMKKKPWMIFVLTSVFISIVDIIISLHVPAYTYRLRRLLRPFIFIQSSSMMKKLLKSVILTVPEILGVLLLLGFHLYFFTMIGMLILPPSPNDPLSDDEWLSNPTGFEALDTAIISLLVLLTTANNPDVMMPSYKQNRFCSIFFIVFSFVGTFLIMNLLTAVIYNQFRGFLQRTLQNSLKRRQLAFVGSFCKLIEAENIVDEEFNRDKEHVDIKYSTIKSSLSLVSNDIANFPKALSNLDNEDRLTLSQYKQLLKQLSYKTKRDAPVSVQTRYPRLRPLQKKIIHPNFDHIGNAIAIINAISLVILAHSFLELTLILVALKKLRIFNLAISVFYLLEQIMKMWAYGIIFCQRLDFLFDSFVAASLIIIQTLLEIEINKSNVTDKTTELLWIFSRIVNILITIRLLRILPKMKVLNLVTSSLVDTLKNLKHVAGILVAAFYLFAIVGNLSFGQFQDELLKNETACGTYSQLDYYSNNFNDFWASVVTLWDLLVVNNWQVFLHKFSKISTWTQVYFVLWWLSSSVIILNIFVALILDNFINRWERAQNRCAEEETPMNITMMEMYEDNLKNPELLDIQRLLVNHEFIRFPLAEHLEKMDSAEPKQLPVSSN
ncbi:unnamed protein product [Oikopleura dioica]|uniref:Ion transport domain-containing protein n=1 Tax=Oikopleura dioica TaxID=34765 RepID=E4YBY5_OIKDI|nr:unnamed protein product [Oikopleura dioica]